MQIMCIRLLQKCRHQPIVLLGGGTTLIGDPSGKDITRKILEDRTIDENINGSEDIEVLTDARFRQNFDLMRYSEEMCDVEIVVEESKFKGSFFGMILLRALNQNSNKKSRF